MGEWKRICCGLDFSPASRLALGEAIDAAARTGAELTLVHVHQPGPPVASVLLANPPDAARFAAGELEGVMQGWCDEATTRLGRHVDGRVLQGSVGDELIRFAREHGMQLMVVGTRRRSRLGRLVLGSVAERVVREAPCSVLVARPLEASVEVDEREEAAQYTASGEPG